MDNMSQENNNQPQQGQQPGQPSQPQQGYQAQPNPYSQQQGQPGYQGQQQYRYQAPPQRTQPSVQYNYSPNPQPQKKGGMPGWLKALLIIAAVLIFAVALGSACTRSMEGFLSPFAQAPTEDYVYFDDYIGILYLDGTITEGESGDGYNHDWMLTRIEEMAVDSYNKGLVLHINTPGGSAYASAELYKDLIYYKEMSGNPLYIYMGSQATSGGYYAAAAGDRIFANEETWTGSIGVVISGLYDLSALFEKYGIKAENIVSGKNKDMGTNIKPMTEEQRQIFQGLVDDTFNRFVDVVARGRKMTVDKARELADGRIYTATQALENGLIDEIGTLEEAVDAMQSKFELQNVDIHQMSYTPQQDLLQYLGLNSIDKLNSAEQSEIGILMNMLERGETFKLMCIAPVQK